MLNPSEARLRQDPNDLEALTSWSNGWARVGFCRRRRATVHAALRTGSRSVDRHRVIEACSGMISRRGTHDRFIQLCRRLIAACRTNRAGQWFFKVRRAWAGNARGSQGREMSRDVARVLLVDFVQAREALARISGGSYRTFGALSPELPFQTPTC